MIKSQMIFFQKNVLDYWGYIYLEASITTIRIARRKRRWRRQFWDWRELSRDLNAAIPNQNSAAVWIQLTSAEKPSIISDPLNDQTLVVKPQNATATASSNHWRCGGRKVQGKIEKSIVEEWRVGLEEVMGWGHFGHYLPLLLKPQSFELGDAEASLRRFFLVGVFGACFSAGSGFGRFGGPGFFSSCVDWSRHWRWIRAFPLCWEENERFGF